MIRTIVQIQGTGKGIQVIVTLKEGGRRVTRVYKTGLLQKDVEEALRTLVAEAQELVGRG